jgi:hypothetical protein
MLHNAFVGLEMLNWVLGLVLIAKLVFRSRKRTLDPDAELS